MARIHGPASGHATLTGTSGADLIVGYGDDNTIIGNGGSDTIFANSGNRDSINVGTLSDGMGALNDSIRLGGNDDTVSGGDENVSVAGYVSQGLITLGNGRDSVRLIGSGNMLSAGGGNDTIRMVGGNDTIAFGGQYGSIYADAVTVGGSHDTVTDSISIGPYPVEGTLNVSGGSGGGVFDLGTTSGTLLTGGVDNVISAGYHSDISAGSGHDTVYVNGGPRDSGGDATIRLAGTGNFVGGYGEPPDTGGYSGNYAVSGGQGYDTIGLSDATGGGMYRISDGGSHDQVVLQNGLAGTVTGGGSFESVRVDSSNATIDFSGRGDSLTIVDTFSGGRTVTVNDHSAGLVVGLGPNQYNPVDHVVLADFDATGIVDFSGGRGGFASVEQIVHDLHRTGAGDYTLTLPDGTGTITFAGDVHLGASNFRIG